MPMPPSEYTCTAPTPVLPLPFHNIQSSHLYCLCRPRRPLQDLLGPVHAHEAVHLAEVDHLQLRRIPQLIVCLGLLEVLPVKFLDAEGTGDCRGCVTHLRRLFTQEWKRTVELQQHSPGVQVLPLVHPVQLERLPGPHRSAIQAVVRIGSVCKV